MVKYFILFIFILSSCEENKSKWTTETLERFDVSYKQDSLVIGNLNYKETLLFDNNERLQNKTIYDKSGKVKGVETLEYSNNNATSNYKLNDSTLLSKYNYKYENGFLLEKRAFDATDNKLLRIEQYNYDEAGNQNEKIILDADGIINRVYKFAFDDFGNELGFSVFNKEGKLVLLETYEITQMDNENRWLKKWAVRDSVIKSYYERTFE